MRYLGKTGKSPLQMPPLPPAHLLPEGTFSMLFRTFPSTILPNLKTTRFFFLFAIFEPLLTGLITKHWWFFFLLMHDNCKPHRLILGGTGFRWNNEACGIACYLSCHVWDRLGRRPAVRSRPPFTVWDFEVGILEDWNNIL